MTPKKLIAIAALLLLAAGFYDSLYELVFPVEVVQESTADEFPPDEDEVEQAKQEEAEPAASAPATSTAPALPTKQAPKLSAKLLEKPAEVKLVIREIKFDGVSAFSQDTLKNVVQEFIGQELTVQEAFAIPAKVTSYYQEHNLVARATLVGSLDRNGMLKIGVIETKMTQTQVNKELSAIAAPAPAAAVVPAPALSPVPAPIAAAKTEAPVSNVAKLEAGEEAAMPAYELKAGPMIPIPEPTVVASKPAAAQNKQQEAAKAVDSETDFILKHYAKRSRQYELLVDNFGYEATGRSRLGAAVDWNNALLEDDKFSLLGLKSQGSSYLRAAYEWATGLDGLSVGASVAKLNYDIVNNLQNAVYVSGDTVKKGFQAMYDLVSDSSETSRIGLIYDTKSITNLALNYSDSEIYTSKSTGLVFKGQVRELVPGGAVLTYDTVYSHGQVNMAGSPNFAADASGEKTDGSFSKLRVYGSILQPLSGTNALFGSLTMQFASKNLDGSEKMYLGGPLGVRAYGVGEGAGSDGRLATLELRQKLGLKTTLAEFYDWGQIRPYHDGSFTPSSVNNTTLKGIGFSLSHEFDSGVSMKGTWARREGPTPDASSMPHGHDGQFDRNRFWLTMESRF
jgi:hemolysin activation/secretion protein